MIPYEVLCGSFWGCYCCIHIVLFSWDILDEKCNTRKQVKMCSDNIVYKCDELCKKIKRKKGYDRVEFTIEEQEPEHILPETGGDKELYKTYKPMDTLYEINEED